MAVTVARSQIEIVKFLGQTFNSLEYIVQVKRGANIGQCFILRKFPVSTVEDKHLSAHLKSERKALVAVRNCGFLETASGMFWDPTDQSYNMVLSLPKRFNLCWQIAFQGYCPTEGQVRFVLAEVIVAVTSLHSLGIVHGRINSRAVWVDGCGHVVLKNLHDCIHVDTLDNNFNLLVNWLPHHQPPEMRARVSCRRHFVTDWWMLGVLAYELLADKTPFLSEGRDQDDMTDKEFFENIENRDPQPLPDGLSPACVDFVMALLNKRPSQRLGNKGAGEVKTHPFFQGLDWGKVERREMESPLVNHQESDNHDGTYVSGGYGSDVTNVIITDQESMEDTSSLESDDSSDEETDRVFSEEETDSDSSEEQDDVSVEETDQSDFNETDNVFGEEETESASSETDNVFSEEETDSASSEWETESSTHEELDGLSHEIESAPDSHEDSTHYATLRDQEELREEETDHVYAELRGEGSSPAEDMDDQLDLLDITFHEEFSDQFFHYAEIRYAEEAQRNEVTPDMFIWGYDHLDLGPRRIM